MNEGDDREKMTRTAKWEGGNTQQGGDDEQQPRDNMTMQGWQITMQGQ
jgi:hypothetical protein